MYISNIDLNSKENIISFVKKVIIKYHKRLNMKGFYKVIIYVNEKVGLFIDICKIDDSLYRSSLDLKIIVNINVLNFYLEETLRKELITPKKFESYVKHLIEIDKMTRSWFNYEKTKSSLRGNL